jgi:GTP-binding protein EngB required for normal cell division
MPTPVWIVVGPSQTGKSSFIKDISGEEVKVGSGGVSCTTKIKLYKARLGDLALVIIDTVGFGGSKLTEQDQEIMLDIEQTLLTYKGTKDVSQIDAIIVTESMKGDAIKLNDTLAKLGSIFSPGFEDSTLCLLTKPNKLTEPGEFEERLTNLKQICTEQQIRGGALPFITSYPFLAKDEIPFEEQLRKLKARLDTLRKYPLDKILEKQNEIKKLAANIKESKKTIQAIKVPTQQLVHVGNDYKKVGSRKYLIMGPRDRVEIPIYETKTVMVDSQTVVYPPDEYCQEQAIAQYYEKCRNRIRMQMKW